MMILFFGAFFFGLLLSYEPYVRIRSSIKNWRTSTLSQSVHTVHTGTPKLLRTRNRTQTHRLLVYVKTVPDN